jgi:uncharacterized membrane protein (UPF0127 family)
MASAVQLVRVRNATRGTTLAASAEVARSPLRRFLGLMGQTGSTGTDGLVIRPCSAVHTCFMRIPIDVVFANRDGVVLDVAPDRPPWRLGPVAWRAAWALELPAGAIAASRTCLDDVLVLESTSALAETRRG